MDDCAESEVKQYSLTPGGGIKNIDLLFLYAGDSYLYPASVPRRRMDIPTQGQSHSEG